jgi:hypothetical protein
MDRITTTIKCEWLRQIVARTKRVEYRKLKSYWDKEPRDGSTPVRAPVDQRNGCKRARGHATFTSCSCRVAFA